MYRVACFDMLSQSWNGFRKKTWQVISGFWFCGAGTRRITDVSSMRKRTQKEVIEMVLDFAEKKECVRREGVWSALIYEVLSGIIAEEIRKRIGDQWLTEILLSANWIYRYRTRGVKHSPPVWCTVQKLLLIVGTAGRSHRKELLRCGIFMLIFSRQAGNSGFKEAMEYGKDNQTGACQW